MKIYVCITSIPPRAKNLPIVVDAFLKNSIIPDRIVISLCKTYKNFNEPFDISVLDKYKTNPIVRVVNLEEDLGSVTKLLGNLDELLKEDDKENKYLVTFDDDAIPKSFFTEHFRNLCTKEPSTPWAGFMERQASGTKGVINVGFCADGFSFRLSDLTNFKEFCLTLIDDNQKWSMHDDMCFSAFWYLNNMQIKGTGKGGWGMRDPIANPVDEHSITQRCVNNNDPRGVNRNRALFASYNKLLDEGKLEKFKLVNS